MFIVQCLQRHLLTMLEFTVNTQVDTNKKTLVKLFLGVELLFLGVEPLNIPQCDCKLLFWLNGFSEVCVHLCDMGSNYGENVFHLSCTHPEIFPVPLRMSTELLYQIVVIPLLLSLLIELVHPELLLFLLQSAVQEEKSSSPLSVCN